MAGIFKKIIQGILIGGGTVLSLLCPPVGGAVITAGMAIGAGAVAAGSLINTGTVDKPLTTINSTLTKLGLLNPAVIPSNTGTGTSFGAGFVLSPMAWLAIAGGLALLIFKPFKRGR